MLLLKVQSMDIRTVLSFCAAYEPFYLHHNMTTLHTLSLTIVVVYTLCLNISSYTYTFLLSYMVVTV